MMKQCCKLSLGVLLVLFLWAPLAKAQIIVKAKLPTIFDLCREEKILSKDKIQKAIDRQVAKELGPKNTALWEFRQEHGIKSEWDLRNFPAPQVREYWDHVKAFRAKQLKASYQIDEKFLQAKHHVRSFLDKYLAKGSSCHPAFANVIDQSMLPMDEPEVVYKELYVNYFGIFSSYLLTVNEQFDFYSSTHELLTKLDRWGREAFFQSALVPAVLGCGYHHIEDEMPGQYQRVLAHELGHLLTLPQNLLRKLSANTQLKQDFPDLVENIEHKFRPFHDEECDKSIEELFVCLGSTALCNYKDDHYGCGAEVFADLTSAISLPKMPPHYYREHCFYASENQGFDFSKEYATPDAWESYPGFSKLKSDVHPSSMERYEVIFRPFGGQHIHPAYVQGAQEVINCARSFFNDEFGREYSIYN